MLRHVILSASFLLPPLVLAGCAPYFGAEHKVTIRLVTSPIPAAERVYVTGNQEALGGWKPAAVQLERRADTLFERTFTSLRGKPAAEIVQGIVDAGSAWAGGRAQDDDVTIVVMRRAPEGEAREERSRNSNV